MRFAAICRSAEALSRRSSCLQNLWNRHVSWILRTAVRRCAYSAWSRSPTSTDARTRAHKRCVRVRSSRSATTAEFLLIASRFRRASHTRLAHCSCIALAARSRFSAARRRRAYMARIMHDRRRRSTAAISALRAVKSSSEYCAVAAHHFFSRSQLARQSPDLAPPLTATTQDAAALERRAFAQLRDGVGALALRQNRENEPHAHATVAHDSRLQRTSHVRLKLELLAKPHFSLGTHVHLGLLNLETGALQLVEVPPHASRLLPHPFNLLRRRVVHRLVELADLAPRVLDARVELTLRLPLRAQR
eukprot:scaffold8900_cov119-Isochrysis_galbana.AAC.8